MSKIKFLTLLFLIAIFGIILRLVDYDIVPPFGETKDEFMYPWAGISFLKTKVPSSWSFFPSYSTGEIKYYWGEDFMIVSPWVEKPPLYSLITGAVALLAGQNNFGDVRLSTIRLVPIFLSFFTILLVGLLAKSIFQEKIALIASILYATTPTIVMANRLSLTENLLVPITLFTVWIYSINFKNNISKYKPYIVGLGCALALLTKNIALILPLALIVLSISKKELKDAIIITLISGIGAIIHPLLGLFYDWGLFLNVLSDYRIAHGLGLPAMVETLFRFPVISHKEKIFMDGVLLSGYILLFTAPFWLKDKLKENILLLISVPFAIIVSLTLLEGGTTFYGWHLFPIYPFLIILVAKAFFDLWQKPQFLELIFFLLIIGISSLRFFLSVNTSLQNSWQYIFAVLFFISAIFWIFGKEKYQRLLLFSLFIIFIFVNLLTVWNLNQIYGSYLQPLQ